MASKSITQSFFSILSGKMAATLVVLFSTPIIVRLLGSDGYGDYAFVFSMFTLATIVSDIGLFDSIRKFIAEDPGNKIYASKLSSISYILGVLLWIILAMFILVVISFYSRNGKLDSDMFSYLILMLFALGGNQLFRISRSILMGLQMENKSETLIPLQQLVFGTFAIILAYLGYGVVGVLLAFSIGFWVVGLIGLKRVTSNISMSINFQKSDFKQIMQILLTYGFYSAILVFLSQSLYQADVIMVRYFLTNMDTGYYKAALQTSEFLWFIPWALQIALLHSSSNIWANDGKEQISKITSKLIKYTVVFTLLLVIGIAVLSNSFLAVYFGSEFVAAKIPLLLLLPGVFGFSISRIIMPVIQGKGELKPLIILMVGISSMNIILNYLFIPRYGIAGAAMATSISYGSMLLLGVHVAKKTGIVLDFGISWIRMSYVIGITLLVSYVLFTPIISYDLAKLIIVPVLISLLYFVLIVRFKIMKIEEMIKVIDLLPGSVNKRTKQIFDRLMLILE